MRKILEITQEEYDIITKRRPVSPCYNCGSHGRGCPDERAWFDMYYKDIPEELRVRENYHQKITAIERIKALRKAANKYKADFDEKIEIVPPKQDFKCSECGEEFTTNNYKIGTTIFSDNGSCKVSQCSVTCPYCSHTMFLMKGVNI